MSDRRHILENRGNSKGLGKVHRKCFIQVSRPGPGGLEETEVFLLVAMESVYKTGRTKGMSATETER